MDYARLNDNGTLAYSSYSKVFSFKRYDVDDNLIADFIPALDETGRPCMYDLVSQTPFYTQGTTEVLYKVKEAEPIII